MDYALAYNINRMARLGVGGLGGTDLRAQVIEALFGAGEQGLIQDSSDSSVAFQTTAASTAAGNGDPYGYAGDVSPNSNNVTQASAPARPLRSSSSGVWSADFDGVDDFWASDGVASMAQAKGAFSLYLAVQFVTVETRYFAGFSTTTSAAPFHYFRYGSGIINSQRNDGSTNSNLTVSTGLSENTPYVVGIDFNGTQTAVSINGGTPATVTQDINLTTIDAFSFGALRRDSMQLWSEIKLHAAIVREGNMTPSQKAIANEWLAAKSGATLA